MCGDGRPLRACANPCLRIRRKRGLPPTYQLQAVQRLDWPSGQSKQAPACPIPKHGTSLQEDTLRDLLSNWAGGFGGRCTFSKDFEGHPSFDSCQTGAWRHLGSGTWGNRVDFNWPFYPIDNTIQDAEDSHSSGIRVFQNTQGWSLRLFWCLRGELVHL